MLLRTHKNFINRTAANSLVRHKNDVSCRQKFNIDITLHALIGYVW